MIANYNGSAQGSRNGSENIPAPAASSTATASRGAAQRRQGSVNWSFLLVFASTNVPQPFPGYLVAPGCSVRVRATNGAAGNAHVAFAATNPDSLRSGVATPLQPLDDVAFPVSNTARVWAMGTAGDGVVISVSSNSNS